MGTLTKDAVFGEVVLKPGFYLVADETSGVDHRVSFSRA